jgi:hypothetical protein
VARHAADVDEEVVLPLTIRDLTLRDLPSCTWSGSATHLASMAKALERAERGDVDYLAVCVPSGLPVAVGGVDYAKNPGAGTLWQLVVVETLQSCGIGTLYERLGFVAYGRESDSWDEDASDGSITRYDTVCTLMQKNLP